MRGVLARLIKAVNLDGSLRGAGERALGALAGGLQPARSQKLWLTMCGRAVMGGGHLVSHDARALRRQTASAGYIA